MKQGIGFSGDVSSHQTALESLNITAVGKIQWRWHVKGGGGEGAL